MVDYPMPRNNCFYFYLHVRKKGETHNEMNRIDMQII